MKGKYNHPALIDCYIEIIPFDGTDDYLIFWKLKRNDMLVYYELRDIPNSILKELVEIK
jgi:hypothetical protein